MPTNDSVSHEITPRNIVWVEDDIITRGFSDKDKDLLKQSYFTHVIICFFHLDPGPTLVYNDPGRDPYSPNYATWWEYLQACSEHHPYPRHSCCPSGDGIRALGQMLKEKRKKVPGKSWPSPMLRASMASTSILKVLEQIWATAPQSAASKFSRLREVGGGSARKLGETPHHHPHKWPSRRAVGAYPPNCRGSGHNELDQRAVLHLRRCGSQARRARAFRVLASARIQ